MSEAYQDPVEQKPFTYADYRQWELKKGERYELIKGIAYAMAAPNEIHQLISGEIFRQIANFLRGKPCKVFPAPYDVRLFYEEDDSDDTVVQPDITVLCDAKKRGPEGCRGTPDMIIEILSPSNSGEDYITKFNLYMEAGVKEYWFISPVNKTVTVNILEDGKYYTETFKADATLPVKTLEGLSITLSDVFAG
jgi:Uma2 family endonuclease